MRSVLLTILAVLSGIFAVQNVAHVPITFVIWQTETYLAVAILTAMLLGFLIGALSMLSWGMRAHKETKAAHKRLAELQARAPLPQAAVTPARQGPAVPGQRDRA